MTRSADHTRTGRALHWFRRDLRLDDNRALHHACANADSGVVALFAITPGQWREHHDAPVKIDFWLRCLKHLAPKLAERNIPLKIITVEKAADIPRAVLDAATQLGCDTITLNREEEVNERRRDDRLAQLADTRGIAVHAADDRAVVTPGAIRTKDGNAYTVFTPFQNRFIDLLPDFDTAPRDAPPEQPPTDIKPDTIPDAVPGFESNVDTALWPAGEDAARQRLDDFLHNRGHSYKNTRDTPAVNGTSGLSPYLAAGVLSPRRALHDAIAADGGHIRVGKAYTGAPSGIGGWISELIWREFYIHLTRNVPRLCMNQSFKPVGDQLPWSTNDEHFHAWCEGRTGYPFVDAAMRQLNTIGWMHNRLRMVTAMFLTKDLFIDWRRGEQYFMHHLIDGDLASNNGGWQWSASCGTDAAPYFRIYNPTTQGERFDPQGDYTRHWLPELAGIAGKAIHDPAKLPPLARHAIDYPEPIVNHATARDHAIQAFKDAS